VTEIPPTPAAGPSGGALGKNAGIISREILENHPDLARQIVTIGRHPRPGHDRKRWETVNWDDYRAQVGVMQSSGPWRIEVRTPKPDDVTDWILEAEDLPRCQSDSAYTALVHEERGLVMSDVPAEIAGALPFLDTVTAWSTPRLLVAGLGLGIVPAWLLANTTVTRVDVVEIDPHVIDLITRDRDQDHAPNAWTNDPRLHIHHGDAHLWHPGPRHKRGCCLHADCTLWSNSIWHGAWFDIWDLVSPSNLPSMHRLTRHFARRVYKMWSWERPACEAMRSRGQTLERPCFISEAGYPDAETEEISRCLNENGW
jgi:hypothetical protein